MASGKTIDAKAFIDERSISPYQWLLVALCFLIVTADGMDVAIMGFVAPSIIHDWEISRPAFGLGWQFGAILAVPAVPATCAAIAILLAQRTHAIQVAPQPNTAHCNDAGVRRICGCTPVTE
jgi:hypothetical protein